jgi:hypothetical protein
LLANQERVTAENIAKVQLQVQRLTKGAKADPPVSATPPNGKAEKPSEARANPNSDEASDAVTSKVAEDHMDDKNNEEVADGEVETV